MRDPFEALPFGYVDPREYELTSIQQGGPVWEQSYTLEIFPTT